MKAYKTYWCVRLYCGVLEPVQNIDLNHLEDRDNKQLGNYFQTREEAVAMAEKIKAVLKGEELIK